MKQTSGVALEKENRRGFAVFEMSELRQEEICAGVWVMRVAMLMDGACRWCWIVRKQWGEKMNTS